MSIHSLSPSLFSSQPFLTGNDFENNSLNDQLKGRYDQNQISSKKLVEDIYQLKPSDNTGNTRPVESAFALQSIATRSEQSAELTITTQEGDVVTIKFNQFSSSQTSALQMQQGDKQLLLSEESASFASDYSLSIEGELNEDEQKSLTDLMQKMDKVSEKFFNGNINAAFAHAQKIGFDTEQISSFSMNLHSEKSIQAVAAYQQTLFPEQNINTDMLKQASNFLEQVKVFMDDAVAVLDVFAEPKQTFTDLFSSIAEIHPIIFQDESEADLNNNIFSKVIDNIANEIMANKDTPVVFS